MAYTLSSRDYKSPQVVVKSAKKEWCIGNGQVHQLYLSKKVGALNCMDDQQKVLRAGEDALKENGTRTVIRRLTPLECERLQGFPDNWTLIGEPKEMKDKDGNVIDVEYYYTDSSGKKRRVTDSARYKAIGNSIATPFWFWLIRRISAQYEGPATLGSLFDGISGFPYCHVRCNGTGSVLWSSEIEEFPMAVAKQHFGDEETGQEGDIREFL